MVLVIFAFKINVFKRVCDAVSLLIWMEVVIIIVPTLNLIYFQLKS